MNTKRQREGLLHDLLNKAFRNPAWARHALATAKSAGSDILKAFLKRSVPLPSVQQALLPNPFPQDFASCNATGPTLPYTRDIRSECLISAHALSLVSPSLCDFLARQERYENSLLLGDFAVCSDVLQSIEDDFGFSVWLSEAKVTLAHTSGGEDAVNRLAQEFPPAYHTTLLGFLIKFHIYRTNLVLRPSEYDAAIQFMLGPRDYPSNGPGGVAYLKARILPYSAPDVDEEHLADLLYTEQRFPVIDRLLGLLKALKFLLVAGTQSLRQLAGETINLLPTELRQRSWIRNTPILTSPRSIPPSEAKAEEYRACYALFVVGEHSACLERTGNALVEHPSCFEFCELHVKTLVRLGTRENPFTNLQGTQAQLLQWLYAFHARGKDAAFASMMIAAVAQRHPDSQLSSRIGLFLTELRVSCESFPVLSILDSAAPEFDLPRFMALTLQDDPWRSVPERHKLARYVAELPLARAGLLDEDGRCSSKVPQAAASALEALAAFLSGDFALAAELWRRILNAPDSDVLDRFDALKGLLRSLFIIQDHTLLAREAVDAYIKDPSLLQGLILVIPQEFDQRPERARGDINYPLFLLLAAITGDSNLDLYRLYAALDDLLEANGVERPTHLRANSHIYAKEKLCLLLEDVCAMDVLAYSSAYKSTIELEEERIGILEWLCELSPENRELYLKELHGILRTQSIRGTIQRVHQSKIYVNTNALRATYITVIDQHFERIRSARPIDSALAGRDDSPASSVATRVAFKLFTTLFGALRRDYLFNNECGLDSYLSVRIRHGTLSGQLRSEFEKHRLVTRRAADGSYHENKEWLDYLEFSGFDPQFRRNASDCFTAFSRTIYSIIETVRAEWIQIHTEPHEPGMFNFEFTENELIDMYLDVAGAESAEVFLDRQLAHLWNRTCRNLAQIQDRVRGELKELLLSALDKLERELFPGPLQRTKGFELVKAIANCRTGVQMQVATVADWFTGNEPGDVSSFELDLLVDACMDFTTKINPGRVLEVDKSIASLCLCGQFMDHFFSIFSILIDNVFKHGSTDAERFSLAVSVASERLEILVRCPIKVSEQEVFSTISSRVNNLSWQQSDDSIRQEEGSGFKKLHKIIRRDLSREDYTIATAVDDGFFITSITMSAEGLIHAGTNH